MAAAPWRWAASALAGLAAGRLLHGYFEVMYLINGLIAGLVAITAGAHALSAPAAVFTGAIGAWVMAWANEVYEHMVYDGQAHHSLATHAGLAARTLIVSSFGKTYHVTGWKVGYALAPEPLMAEFRKVHQFNVFTVNTPMQHGLAAYLADPAPYLGLSAFYQAKRDRFRAGLARTRFALLPCEGTYFQCVDYQALAVPERQLDEANGDGHAADTRYGATVEFLDTRYGVSTQMQVPMIETNDKEYGQKSQ